MAKTVQIRNVPYDVHRKLKARAAEQGTSLSDYLLRLAERDVGRPTRAELDAGRPTLAELTERIRRETPEITGLSSADIIREMRGPIPPVD